MSNLISSYNFIINPTAGSGSAASIGSEIESVLSDRDLDFQIIQTEYAGHAREIAARFGGPKGTSKAVIAVGGDGTIHEVASSLLGLAAEQRPAFGILPAGTGNDYGKMFDLGKGLEQQIDNILDGREALVDTAKLSWSEDGGKGETHFVNLVGIGFDALAAAKQQSNKSIKGSAGYILAVLSTLASKKTFPVQVEIKDGDSWKTVFNDRLLLASIGMGKSAGGIFQMNPFAVVDDGLIEYCCVGDLSIPRILSLIPSVIRGRHWESRFVTKGKMKEIRIKSVEGLPVQTDGEVKSMLAKSIHIEIFPSSLRILARTL